MPMSIDMSPDSPLRLLPAHTPRAATIGSTRRMVAASSISGRTEVEACSAPRARASAPCSRPKWTRAGPSPCPSLAEAQLEKEIRSRLAPVRGGSLLLERRARRGRACRGLRPERHSGCAQRDGRLCLYLRSPPAEARPEAKDGKGEASVLLIRALRRASRE